MHCTEDTGIRGKYASKDGRRLDSEQKLDRESLREGRQVLSLVFMKYIIVAASAGKT
jgi:hypothetical protein